MVARAALNPALRPQAITIVRRDPALVRRTVLLGFLKDRDGTLSSFERAIATRHTDEPRLVYFPSLKWLRKDPRYIAAVRSMKMTPP